MKADAAAEGVWSSASLRVSAWAHCSAGRRAPSDVAILRRALLRGASWRLRHTVVLCSLAAAVRPAAAFSYSVPAGAQGAGGMSSPDTCKGGVPQLGAPCRGLHAHACAHAPVHMHTYSGARTGTRMQTHSLQAPPPPGADSISFLKENGVQIAPLDVLGAEVIGLDLRCVAHACVLSAAACVCASRRARRAGGHRAHAARPLGLRRKTQKDSKILPVLEKEMAARGYLVFRGQGVLSGDEQVPMQMLCQVIAGPPSTDCLTCVCLSDCAAGACLGTVRRASDSFHAWRASQGAQQARALTAQQPTASCAQPLQIAHSQHVTPRAF